MLNTIEEVDRLSGVLGIEADRGKITHAIEASSFSSMSKIEQKTGRPFKNETDKITSTKFVRKGQKGDWINYFTQEDLALLSQHTSATAQRFGYHL